MDQGVWDGYERTILVSRLGLAWASDTEPPLNLEGTFSGVLITLNVLPPKVPPLLLVCVPKQHHRHCIHLVYIDRSFVSVYPAKR